MRNKHIQQLDIKWFDQVTGNPQSLQNSYAYPCLRVDLLLRALNPNTPTQQQLPGHLKRHLS